MSYASHHTNKSGKSGVHKSEEKGKRKFQTNQELISIKVEEELGIERKSLGLSKFKVSSEHTENEDEYANIAYMKRDTNLLVITEGGEVSTSSTRGSLESPKKSILTHMENKRKCSSNGGEFILMCK